MEYLINSRDKTYDEESMKAYKFLKAYKYFSDGLVKNNWVHSDMDIVVRAHTFSSLKGRRHTPCIMECGSTPYVGLKRKNMAAIH